MDFDVMQLKAFLCRPSPWLRLVYYGIKNIICQAAFNFFSLFS